MDNMENKIEEIYNDLEVYGGVTLFNKGDGISITVIDDKEGYSYIAGRNDEKFNDGRNAIKWAIDKLHGIEGWE
ncbi:hypothetical protein [Fonticella tunisiensis]|uniref:Uncharacterized protein n=1 Tax=Fonticella tunisiensis TaxID=1096341 RepID=A0A4R7KRS9_9CLOT|nr:hypothetical protein [Fonticella tunisiensis]TDT62294.1 hypothetical protein EDD71_10416 [Fonticella tunisiensis]